MRAAAAVLALASCHWAAGGFGRRGAADDGDSYNVTAAGPECRETRPQVARKPPAPAAPDFAKLGAYRSYFRVTHVDPPADHFAISFDCVEQSIAVYGVSPDGTVRFESGRFSGLGIRGGTPRDVPSDKQGAAQRALAQLAADSQDYGGATVKYLGSYREVTVEEVVPVTGPGDPYKRMTWYQRAIIPMNADLTQIIDKPGIEGGETLLCWKDIDELDCGDARWMDFDVAPVGAPQLAALLTDGSPAAPADRARFLAALTAAGNGAAPIATDALLARQGGGLLPKGFDTPLRAGFSIRRYGKPGAPIDLRVALSAGQIARGHASGTATGSIDGVTLSLAIEAAPEAPVTADGGAKLRVHFRDTLDDGHGARTGEVIDDVDLTVDGDAAAVWSLGLSAESNKHASEAPVVQKMDGLRADFGVNWQIEPWYPK